jgi:hypothetical protein
MGAQVFLAHFDECTNARLPLSSLHSAPGRPDGERERGPPRESAG